MNTADVLVYLLEKDGNRFIFGHPGEQILPFYRSLKDSSIDHVLTRHEQGAAHAADAYARASGDYGICISTAGPGAMNLVMGVSTAFKDSVPLLVITGDNDYSKKDLDIFQSFPINSVFENISIKSFHPHDAKSAISNLIEALIILHKFPKGPVHINLSRDVLLEDVDFDSVDLSGISLADDFDSVDLSGISLSNDSGSVDLSGISLVNDSTSLELSGISGKFDIFNDSLDDLYNFTQNISSDVDNNIQLAIKKLQDSQKPLFIIGNGVVWSKATLKLKDFLSKTMVPIVTTYHSKGIVSEDDKLNLGIVGLRGNSLSNYAYENSDCILALGAKLSERTIGALDFDLVKDKIIHVNIDGNCLKGDIKICMDVSRFLDLIFDELEDYQADSSWIDEIYSHYEELVIDGIEDEESNFNPLRPPYAINKIVSSFEGAYFISDAGTHTTWTTLLVKSDSFGKLLFSGGFGPMGYSLPGAIGVAFALKKAKGDDSSNNDNCLASSIKGNHGDRVVVICGDGDIQMVIQELATIKEYDLNIGIFIINNSQLGIIRQWEETVYGFDKYQVDLANPDFSKLANAYGIDSMRVESKDDLELAIEKYKNSNKAFLADVCVCEENIPLPKK